MFLGGCSRLRSDLAGSLLKLLVTTWFLRAERFSSTLLPSLSMAFPNSAFEMTIELSLRVLRLLLMLSSKLGSTKGSGSPRLDRASTVTGRGFSLMVSSMKACPLWMPLLFWANLLQESSFSVRSKSSKLKLSLPTIFALETFFSFGRVSSVRAWALSSMWYFFTLSSKYSAGFLAATNHTVMAILTATTIMRSSESMKVLLSFWLLIRPRPHATTLSRSRQRLARHRQWTGVSLLPSRTKMLGLGNILAKATSPKRKLVAVAMTSTTTLEMTSICLGFAISGLMQKMKTARQQRFSRQLAAMAPPSSPFICDRQALSAASSRAAGESTEERRASWSTNWMTPEKRMMEQGRQFLWQSRFITTAMPPHSARESSPGRGSTCAVRSQLSLSRQVLMHCAAVRVQASRQEVQFVPAQWSQPVGQSTQLLPTTSYCCEMRLQSEQQLLLNRQLLSTQAVQVLIVQFRQPDEHAMHCPAFAYVDIGQELTHPPFSAHRDEFRQAVHEAQVLQVRQAASQPQSPVEGLIAVPVGHISTQRVRYLWQVELHMKQLLAPAPEQLQQLRSQGRHCPLSWQQLVLPQPDWQRPAIRKVDWLQRVQELLLLAHSRQSATQASHLPLAVKQPAVVGQVRRQLLSLVQKKQLGRQERQTISLLQLRQLLMHGTHVPVVLFEQDMKLEAVPQELTHTAPCRQYPEQQLMHELLKQHCLQKLFGTAPQLMLQVIGPESMSAPEEVRVVTVMVVLQLQSVAAAEVSPSRMAKSVPLMMLVVLGISLTTVTLVGVPSIEQAPQMEEQVTLLAVQEEEVKENRMQSPETSWLKKVIVIFTGLLLLRQQESLFDSAAVRLFGRVMLAFANVYEIKFVGETVFVAMPHPTLGPTDRRFMKEEMLKEMVWVVVPLGLLAVKLKEDSLTADKAELRQLVQVAPELKNLESEGTSIWTMKVVLWGMDSVRRKEQLVVWPVTAREGMIDTLMLLTASTFRKRELLEERQLVLLFETTSFTQLQVPMLLGVVSGTVMLTELPEAISAPETKVTVVETVVTDPLKGWGATPTVRMLVFGEMKETLGGNQTEKALKMGRVMLGTKERTILAGEQTVSPTGERLTGQLAIQVMVVEKAEEEVSTRLLPTLELKNVLIPKGQLFGVAGFLTPLTVIVKLLFVGRAEEAVRPTVTVLVALLKSQPVKVVVRPSTETVQEGEEMTKSMWKARAMAGLLPSGCPVRKLKVKTEEVTMAVVDWETLPLELLKAAAEAVTGVLSRRYESEFRLKLKEMVTGVSEGGKRKLVHQRQAITGNMYSVLQPALVGKVKVTEVEPKVGVVSRQRGEPERQIMRVAQLMREEIGEQETSTVSSFCMVIVSGVRGNLISGFPQLALTLRVVLVNVPDVWFVMQTLDMAQPVRPSILVRFTSAVQMKQSTLEAVCMVGGALTPPTLTMMAVGPGMGAVMMNWNSMVSPLTVQLLAPVKLAPPLVLQEQVIVPPVTRPFEQ